MKLLILGYARHGKDEVATLLHKHFGMPFADSSRTAVKLFLFDRLREKYGYSDFEECYQDRVNHRKEWFEAIREFNKGDRTRLARRILEESDVYVGMRCKDEVQSCVLADLFDAIWWVDASKRLTAEPDTSCTVDASFADLIIDNNGTPFDLGVTVFTAMESYQ